MKGVGYMLETPILLSYPGECIMSYNNFKAALYCPVQNLIDIEDTAAFAREFSFLEKHVKLSKVYLETYRGGVIISREKIKELIAFFQSRGIKTSGGITTDTSPGGEGGFDPFCYTDPETREKLRDIVIFTAGLFDEIILDDFFFTNCKCERCIAEKSGQSWVDFRLKLMKEVSEDVIVGPAKSVNPGINMIIKYPNWYEHYQECGYNLLEQPGIFDSIYTGTETRNPAYTQQHLPKYTGYFLFRYLENVAPGRNLGGWFDPYECSYNLTSYADQAYLTLLAKAGEATLFCLGSLLEPAYSLFAPVAGRAFSDMDEIVPKLGSPKGIACYVPYHSRGEDYLHDYIGMLGIPLEPYPQYPEGAGSIFLTESAAHDPCVIKKLEQSLLDGADVVVTSGFIKHSSPGFQKIANISCTGRSAKVSGYAYSDNGGVFFGGLATGSDEIIIPQLEYPTNDVWEIAGAFGCDNSFPMLLKTLYGKGRLWILTVPDDWGGLYSLPKEVLRPIRQAFCRNLGIVFDGPANVALFAYDNDTIVLRSFLPYYDTGRLTVPGEGRIMKDIQTGEETAGAASKGETVFDVRLMPGINRFLGFK